MSFQSGYALVVGVGEFAYHPEYNVPITVQDAEAVAEILTNSQKCGYLPGQVTVLTGPNTTKEKIVRALYNLSIDTGPEDTVFLFLCSHGYFGTDDEWYFKPYDVRLAGKKVIPETGLGSKELIELFQKIKAERLFIVFNTCFSGHAAPQALGGEAEEATPDTLNPDPKTVNAILGSGKGRIVITAAAENQKSYFDKESPLTYFTQALVDGLNGTLPIRSRGGYIGAFDLYNELYFEVKEAVKEEYGKEQEPEITVIKKKGPFPVALAHGGDEGSLGAFDAADSAIAGKKREVRESKAKRAAEMVMQINTTTTKKIKTGGGAYFGGDVTAKDGGTIIGRDQVIHGSSYSTGDVGEGSQVVQGSGTAVGPKGVSVGGDNTGNIITGDHNTINQSPEAAEAFETILAALAQRQDEDAVFDNDDVQDVVEELQAEAVKPDAEADENRLKKLFTKLGKMAPDIFEVTVATLANPIAGIALVAQKIAQKAKGELEK